MAYRQRSEALETGLGRGVPIRGAARVPVPSGDLTSPLR